VGEAVQFLGGEGAVGRGGVRRGVRVRPGAGHRRAGGGAGQAEEFGCPLLGGEGVGGPAFGLVGAFRRGGGVRRAGRGEFRAGLAGGPGRPAGRLPGGAPGGDGGLRRVAGGEGGRGRIGVGGAVVEPAGPDRFGGLLLDLGEALLEVAEFAAGPLGLGGGGGGVAVGGVADLLERGGPLLALVGELLGVVGGHVQGADQIGGGLRAGGQGRGRVPFGLLDRGGHPAHAVGGGTVPQDGLGGLPGGVQGAGVGEFAFLRGGG